MAFQSAGATLMYLPRLKSSGPHPAVLVIHENHGLVQPHFRDVTRRLAKEGMWLLPSTYCHRREGRPTCPTLRGPPGWASTAPSMHQCWDTEPKDRP